MNISAHLRNGLDNDGGGEGEQLGPRQTLTELSEPGIENSFILRFRFCAKEYNIL